MLMLYNFNLKIINFYALSDILFSVNSILNLPNNCFKLSCA